MSSKYRKYNTPKASDNNNFNNSNEMNETSKNDSIGPGGKQYYVVSLKLNNTIKSITVYPNSNSSELAYNFCKENNLDFQSLEMIKNTLDEALTQLGSNTKGESNNNKQITNINNITNSSLGSSNRKSSLNNQLKTFGDSYLNNNSLCNHFKNQKNRNKNKSIISKYLNLTGFNYSRSTSKTLHKSYTRDSQKLFACDYKIEDMKKDLNSTSKDKILNTNSCRNINLNINYTTNSLFENKFDPKSVRTQNTSMHYVPGSMRTQSTTSFFKRKNNIFSRLFNDSVMKRITYKRKCHFSRIEDKILSSNVANDSYVNSFFNGTQRNTRTYFDTNEDYRTSYVVKSDQLTGNHSQPKGNFNKRRRKFIGDNKDNIDSYKNLNKCRNLFKHKNYLNKILNKNAKNVFYEIIENSNANTHTTTNKNSMLNLNSPNVFNTSATKHIKENDINVNNNYSEAKPTIIYDHNNDTNTIQHNNDSDGKNKLNYLIKREYNNCHSASNLNNIAYKDYNDVSFNKNEGRFNYQPLAYKNKMQINDGSMVKDNVREAFQNLFYDLFIDKDLSKEQTLNKNNINLYNVPMDLQYELSFLINNINNGEVYTLDEFIFVMKKIFTNMNINKKRIFISKYSKNYCHYENKSLNRRKNVEGEGKNYDGFRQCKNSNNLCFYINNCVKKRKSVTPFSTSQRNNSRSSSCTNLCGKVNETKRNFYYIFS